MTMLVIFVGAGIGGMVRHALGSWVQQASGSDFPWGTLVVNVTGSLLLTLIYALLEGTSARAEWRMFLGIGVLGGFTTFSAFSYETVDLLRHDEGLRALAYVLASVVASTGSAFIGYQVGASLLRRG